jgi:hypothetical protein
LADDPAEKQSRRLIFSFNRHKQDPISTQLREHGFGTTRPDEIIIARQPRATKVSE